MATGTEYLFKVSLLLCWALLSTVTNVKSDTQVDDFKKEFAKASYDFTLDLLKAAGATDEDNVLLSPSSIGVLLSMLQQGAGGATAAQLEKVLHLSGENSKMGFASLIQTLQRHDSNVTFEWGNRAYVVPRFELNENFLKCIDENFNATIEELDIGTISGVEAAAKINDWVKEATHDNIKDLVDERLITPDLVMLMVNVIFFKGAWDSPFQRYRTRDDKFQVGPDVKVEVPFMRQEGRFPAGENTDLGIIWTELSFQDENFSMLLILPIKRNGINQVVDKLTGADLREIINEKNTRRVRLTIPKFKLTKKVELADALKKLGLTDVFTAESDLSGIANGELSLQLSHLIHQADIEIDEDGSTASAATFEIVQTLSLEVYSDLLQFKADHPFLFFIIDKVNGIPLFASKVVNPKTSTPT
ncbi:hypothetical protein RUM44_012475 [Polyplax serrata]|uniref:Serpin domain-containing protein n=1 Tax=Polyplax serrata TaxID=468196 RepID=A0ABR1BGB3_POLSC